ncbi:MAG: magnesium chelatase [Marinilabiliales bacterium]|nr:MAG: magnesium chelatase [Marinilabiliales bacterium]
MEENKFESRVDLNELQNSVQKIKYELGKIIIGQEKVIDQMLTAIIANGHVLLEGVPGVAKTLLARLMSKTFNVDFSRIQFTPDLMPSDILGTSVFNMGKSDFEFNKGPIFSNFILIDEINRAPAKTQAALFEVMEERQISIDGKCYNMEKPLLVFATQNPIEQEGTYRLPEAQLDRFLFKIVFEYPSIDEEEKILLRMHNLGSSIPETTIDSVIEPGILISLQEKVHQIHIEENLRKYIAQIITGTRINKNIYLGASPRASIQLMMAAKATAALNNRDFVTPDDIKANCVPVLRHRIILTPEKEMEGQNTDYVINRMMEGIEIPR